MGDDGRRELVIVVIGTSRKPSRLRSPRYNTRCGRKDGTQWGHYARSGQGSVQPVTGLKSRAGRPGLRNRKTGTTSPVGCGQHHGTVELSRYSSGGASVGVAAFCASRRRPSVHTIKPPTAPPRWATAETLTSS